MVKITLRLIPCHDTIILHLLSLYHKILEMQRGIFMKIFDMDFVTNFKHYTKDRIPEFDNLLKMLARQKPSRYTLFEFFLNDELEAHLTGIHDPADVVEYLTRRTEAFRICGYDYVTLHPCDYTFNPIAGNHGKKSRSANDDTLITDRDSFAYFDWGNMEDQDFSRLDKIAKILPGNMKMIIHSPGGVLENVIALTGYDNLCFMLTDDPELVQMLFDKVGQTLLRFYEIAAVHPGVGAAIVNDDWGFFSQTMLSTNDMKKYVIPWHKRISDTIHSIGKPAILHSCGRLDAVMPEVCSLFEGKHSYEDKILPVEDAYDKYGHQIAILGGIDLDFVCRKTPREIYDRACNLLVKTSARGGYALGSGNSIPDYVPNDNFLAMIAAAVVN